MKKGQTVEVIASRPATGQTGIEHLIGERFTILSVGLDGDDKPDGTVSIRANGETIVPQRVEYKLVR